MTKLKISDSQSLQTVINVILDNQYKVTIEKLADNTGYLVFINEKTNDKHNKGRILTE